MKLFATLLLGDPAPAQAMKNSATILSMLCFFLRKEETTRNIVLRNQLCNQHNVYSVVHSEHNMI